MLVAMLCTLNILGGICILCLGAATGTTALPGYLLWQRAVFAVLHFYANASCLLYLLLRLLVDLCVASRVYLHARSLFVCVSVFRSEHMLGAVVLAMMR